MSAIAKQLCRVGYVVSGSDVDETSAKRLLEGYKISINDFNSLKNCDAVVVSSAIGLENKDLVYARKRGKRIISRAELLAEISTNYKKFIGIAGTHGKTTVTALIAHVLKCADFKFTAHIGGLDGVFGNYVNFGDEVFLSEVCEYKQNIKYFSPDVALVLNIDDDHIESYGDFARLQNEFFNYLHRSKLAILSDEIEYSDKNAVYFSTSNPLCDYFISKKTQCDKNLEYCVYEHGEPLFDINLDNFALHDYKNIVSAVAVCRSLKISVQNVVDGINSFKGVKRRNEVVFEKGSKRVVCDYAHHPKQIADAVNFYMKKYGENCKFIFQPHTYSRTKNLFNDFVSALSPCRFLIVYKTYAARESYDCEGSAEQLAKALPNGSYIDDEKILQSAFNRLIDEDNTIIALGAGDIYNLILRFLK